MYADIAMDWSDHALWWPERNHWLTRTRSTLDQYGVAADALLHFTPMHKTLRVQLPDMRCLDCKVDFSVKTFNAVINLCKELGEIFSLKIFLIFVVHGSNITALNELDSFRIRKDSFESG